MRLIDADAIPWDVEGVGEIPVITKDEIDQLPTIEAPTVGVIRCKDCVAYKDSRCVRNNMIAVYESDYCSRAEREEE